MFDNPYATLNDGEVEKSLLGLAAAERVATADIIMHLMIVKERGLFASAGFDSLFNYCVGKLGFSKSAAYRRKAVADKAAEFPELLARIKDGRLHVCAAAAVAPYLKDDCVVALLDAVAGMSHREVEAFLVKRWREQQPKVEAPAAAEMPVLKLPDTSAIKAIPNVGKDLPRVVQRTVVKPLAPQANRVSVTLSDETLKRLQRAKEILGTSDDAILGQALDRLLDEIDPERRHARRTKRAASKVAAPKPAEPMPVAQPSADEVPAPRRAPIAVRDQVTVAAGARCAFVSRDGRRCTARSFIEIDHIKPWALGGSSDAGNLRPLCRTHNALAAERTFGRWHRPASEEAPPQR